MGSPTPAILGSERSAGFVAPDLAALDGVKHSDQFDEKAVSQAPGIIRDPRAAWLEERRKGVGASDVAAILGHDPRRGPLAVYAEKIGALESPDNDWMAFGRDVEGAIAQAYARKTGRPVYDLGAHEIRRHPDLPILGATLDRETSGSTENRAPIEGHDRARVPLELKAVGYMKAKDWQESPPLHFQIQLQAQLACTGAAWGSLAALIGGLVVVWKDIPRNDRFINAMLPRVAEFWSRVERRDPPTAIDARPETSKALKALYAEEDGETLVLPPDAVELADAWEAACLKRRDAEREVDLYENHIRRLIGDASFGDLADGSYLSLAVTPVKGYVKTVPPSSYRRIRRVRPRLPRRNAR